MAVAFLDITLWFTMLPRSPPQLGSDPKEGGEKPAVSAVVTDLVFLCFSWFEVFFISPVGV